ncbi:MAG: hypothetical protein K6T31_09820 [Alicyclobacillus sp.]|nr:hypothetical protein [Alicyclobacillus sp.]
MPTIDALFGAATVPQVPQSSEPTDQASHAAQPQAFTLSTGAKEIVLAVAGILVFFYVLHVIERVKRRG